MEQTNGTTQKKNILFSIGSYNGKEAPVIKKISTNGLFSSSDVPPPMPGTWSSKRRPVSLDFTDDASKRNGYSTLPRMPTTRTYLNGNGNAVEKPFCPPSSPACSRIPENSGLVDKPLHPPGNYKRSMSLEPEQLHHSGRVALTIAAYEGEPRTPTRLEFLPQTRISRSNSKASSIASTPVTEDVELNSRLQNELTATLLRSNLKKKNDEQAAIRNGQENEKFYSNGHDASSKETKDDIKMDQKIENGNLKQSEEKTKINGNVEQSEEETKANGQKENGIVDVIKEETKVNGNEENKDVQKEENQVSEKLVQEGQDVQDDFKFTNVNVKKLADVLGQKMTFKLNPENS